MYEVDHRNNSHPRRRRIAWLAAGMVITVTVISIGVIFMLNHLKTTVNIEQTPPVSTKVTYETKTQHFGEPDFSIDLPPDWQTAPDTKNSSHPYRWQSKDGQVIEIFEDNIPVGFAVNRVLVVEPQVGQLQLNGSVSDNCAEFTKALPGSPGQAVPAKWQGIGFLCDETNQQPNVVGTSSSDGTNTVTLKQTSTGDSHNFFLTYTTRSTNPDYTVFYNTVQSLRLQ